MRFGISATSTICPKYFRSLLRPVNESVISDPCLFRTKRPDSPGGAYSAEGTGDAFKCASACNSRHASLFQLDLRASVFELFFDLLSFGLGHVRLPPFGSSL